MKIASKWRKHQILLQYKSIRRYLPHTYLFSERALNRLLARGLLIYMKPVVGSGGSGIYRIKRMNGRYLVQTGTRRITVSNKRRLLPALRRMTKGKPYLLQQGVNMISLHGRPIDYRLLILKPGNRWLIMGIMGKWAAPNKIVTNHCSGGRPINLSPSLRRSKGLSYARSMQFDRAIKIIGMRVARTLGNRYGLRSLGLDIAIDHRLRIWILEVNTTPQFQLFRYHHNRTLYRKVAAHMRAIRRRNMKRPT